MDFTEVYNALNTGVVDGQENPFNIILTGKLYEVQKHLSLTQHVYGAAPTSVSDKTWAKLPPDLQQVLKEAVARSVVAQRQAASGDVDAQLKKLVDFGMQVVKDPDRAAFQTAMKPAWDQYIGRFGKPGQALIDAIRAEAPRSSAPSMATADPPPLTDGAGRRHRPELEPDLDIFRLPLDWRRWWTILPEIVALACTGSCRCVVGANVLSRYTDWYRILWAEDVVKVLFLWVVFLGGAIAVKYEAHVRMSTLSDRLARPGRAGRLWDQVDPPVARRHGGHPARPRHAPRRDLDAPGAPDAPDLRRLLQHHRPG